MKLRPMITCPNDDTPVYGFYNDGNDCPGVIRTTAIAFHRQTNAVGWLPIDTFELPDEPNPVYWGDEVKTVAGDYVFVIGPVIDDTRRLWLFHTGGGGMRNLNLTTLIYNGRPVTHFEHGKRGEA